MTDEVQVTAENIKSLIERLEAAKWAYETAKDEVSSAKRSETNALNELNRAQKDFDTAVARIRGRYPANSDWGIEVRTAPPVFEYVTTASHNKAGR